ncbi:MAG TPA: ChbG/HpnK family deacetylase [Vicinamibacterales bacterium]
MKYLIVNGDDFGAGRGVNYGIVDAHQRGILTSASLLVDAAGSAEAATLSRLMPRLSVGLHVHLPGDGSTIPAGQGSCRVELRRQCNRFQELMGRAPTHLDSHHDVHRDPRWLPYFCEFAREHHLTLRGYSPVRCFTKFYGQWGGQSHPEHISAASLARMLTTEVDDGVTEFSCHPGHVDPDLSSSYLVEREIELRSLCDPMIGHVVSEHSIQLINHCEADRLIVPSHR